MKTTEHLGRAPFCTFGGPGCQPLFIIKAVAEDPRSSEEETPAPGPPRPYSTTPVQPLLGLQEAGLQELGGTGKLTSAGVPGFKPTQLPLLSSLGLSEHAAPSAACEGAVEVARTQKFGSGALLPKTEQTGLFGVPGGGGRGNCWVLGGPQLHPLTHPPPPLGALMGPCPAVAFPGAKQRGESLPALLSGGSVGDSGSKVFFRPGRRARRSDPGRARPRAGGEAAAGLRALARAGRL